MHWVLDESTSLLLCRNASEQSFFQDGEEHSFAMCDAKFDCFLACSRYGKVGTYEMKEWKKKVQRAPWLQGQHPRVMQQLKYDLLPVTNKYEEIVGSHTHCNTILFKRFVIQGRRQDMLVQVIV